MLTVPAVVWFLRYSEIMKIFTWLRHSFIIMVLYGIGLAELYFLPRYGIEYFLGSIGATVFMAGYWMRTHWNYS